MSDLFSQSFSFHKKHFLFQIQQNGATPNEKCAPTLIQKEPSPEESYHTAQGSVFHTKNQVHSSTRAFDIK